MAVQGSGRSKLGLGILFQRLASWSGESWNLGHSLAVGLAFKDGSVPSHIFSANVPDEVSLLASGVTPAREAEAGGMPEVPKA